MRVFVCMCVSVFVRVCESRIRTFSKKTESEKWQMMAASWRCQVLGGRERIDKSCFCQTLLQIRWKNFLFIPRLKADDEGFKSTADKHFLTLPHRSLALSHILYAPLLSRSDLFSVYFHFSFLTPFCFTFTFISTVSLGLSIYGVCNDIKERRGWDARRQSVNGGENWFSYHPWFFDSTATLVDNWSL